MTHAIICYVYKADQSLEYPIDVRILEKYDCNYITVDQGWFMLSDYDSCGRYKVPRGEEHVLMMLDLRTGLPLCGPNGEPLDVWIPHYDDDDNEEEEA